MDAAASDAEVRRQGAAGQEVRRAAGPGLGPMEPTTLRIGRGHFPVWAGAAMGPICIAFARGPSRVTLTPDAGVKGRSACTPPGRRRQKVRTLSSAPLSPDGDEPKRNNRRRGEHEASRKPHRVPRALVPREARRGRRPEAQGRSAPAPSKQQGR